MLGGREKSYWISKQFLFSGFHECMKDVYGRFKLLFRMNGKL